MPDNDHRRLILALNRFGRLTELVKDLTDLLPEFADLIRDAEAQEAFDRAYRAARREAKQATDELNEIEQRSDDPPC